MDGTVDSTILLQSPASPARSAASPIWMETKVSDVIVSAIPGGPEIVGVLDSERSQQLGHHPSSVRHYHQNRCILTYCRGWGTTCNDTSTGDAGRGGGSTTHQLFGTEGSHSSFEGFHESRHAATTPGSESPSPTSYSSGNGQ